MTDLTREYVVPLRKEVNKAPRWRRSKKAVSVVRDFIKKHMKVERVIICNDLNEKLWAFGGKNVIGKVEVIAVKSKKEDEEFCVVNLKDIGVEKQLELYKRDKVKEKVEKLEKMKEEAKDTSEVQEESESLKEETVEELEEEDNKETQKEDLKENSQNKVKEEKQEEKVVEKEKKR